MNKKQDYEAWLAQQQHDWEEAEKRERFWNWFIPIFWLVFGILAFTLMVLEKS